MAVQQSMILLEKSCIGREIVVKQGLVLLIAAMQGYVQEPKPVDDSASVRVNNERRFVSSVKDNVVGSLRAYAVDAQKLFPQLPLTTSEEGTEVAAVVFYDVSGEGL